MKVVFLDFDGVMTKPQNILSTKHEGLEFDKEAVKKVKHLLDSTGAKIVVSSSWREGKKDADMVKILKVYGLDSYYLGKLPDTYFDEFPDKELDFITYVGNNPEISDFVIIDDFIIFEYQAKQIATELREGLMAIPDKVINQHITRLNLN